MKIRKLSIAALTLVLFLGIGISFNQENEASIGSISMSITAPKAYGSEAGLPGYIKTPGELNATGWGCYCYKVAATCWCYIITG